MKTVYRLISMLLCAVMLAASLVMSVGAAYDNTLLPMMKDDSYSLGDVNCDGEVNSADSLILKKKVAGFGDEVKSMDAADFDADGVVTAKDTFYLKSVFSHAKEISDYESDARIYRLTIGGYDISSFCIVIPNGTNPDEDNTYLAAQLFQTYIKAASGVKLEICEGEKKTEHAIIIHAVEYKSAEAKELGLDVEDYVYEVKNGDLHTYGTLRGNMYAAYEIIEDYLGFKYFCKDYVYSYEHRTLDIPEGTHVYHPVMLEFRFCGTPFSDDYGTRIYQLYYAARLNGTQIYSNGNRFEGYQTGPHFINAHSFGYYWKMGTGTMPSKEEAPGQNVSQRLQLKYNSGFQQNEYAWQPCGSSDESYYTAYNGMLETIEMIQGWAYSHQYTEDVQKYGIYSMSFSICDNGAYCTCSVCTAKAEGRTVKITGSAATVTKQLEPYTGEHVIGASAKNRTEVTFKKEGYSGVYLALTNRCANEITTEYKGDDTSYSEREFFEEEGIRTVYPGMKVYMIIYDHTVPETVRPVGNLILMYCGHGCNQHILGTGDCGDGLTPLGGSNKEDEFAMKAWADMCHESGASIWYWSYGVTYYSYLAPCPNILDFYYNYYWICNYCKFDGVYYESMGGPHNNFEEMKSYLSTKMLWEPDMTYEEFTDIVKEYMYMYYGKGYEQIYQYMLMQCAAGDACGYCSINNHDRPWDMYSHEYIAEHYEEMRDLILEAIDLAENEFKKHHTELLLLSCEFMGLSATYNSNYVNGTTAQKEEYTKRYTWLYNYLDDNNIDIYGDTSIYVLPDELTLDENPMVQFYEFGAWRECLNY